MRILNNYDNILTGKLNYNFRKFEKLWVRKLRHFIHEDNIVDFYVKHFKEKHKNSTKYEAGIHSTSSKPNTLNLKVTCYQRIVHIMK